MATRDRLLAELEKGGFSTKAYIARYGGTYASVHTSLKRMRDRGIVVELRELAGIPLPEPTWFLVSKIANAGAQAAKPNVTAPITGAPATYTQAQKQAQANPPKKLRTRAIIVVDDSGSMHPYRYEMNDSVNKTLADFRQQAFVSGQQIDVSLYYFNNFRVKPAFRHVDAKDVKSEPIHYPDGGTPLFNAVEDAIRDHLIPERGDEEVGYLLIVITDGDDNESRDRTGNTMKSLIRQVQGTDRWTITFQMPPGTKSRFCNSYGVHPGNCMEWELSSKGIKESTVARTASVGAYMSTRAAGKLSMDTFYTDLSDLDVKDLKKNLANVQDKVRTWTVPSGSPEIRPFIEEKTGTTYQAGSVFYQLTKPEKIQDTKKLLIKEKGGRAMYAGNEARQLLGLPVGQDCRVKPGNHANFDLFVQSTSVNRKLVQGTVVVHWPLSLQ
jgi:hypothetical protein